MDESERKAVRVEFSDAVNLAPKEMERWLATNESQSVGQDAGDGESKGHKMGRRIVELKRKRKDDLTEDDYDTMRKVISYVRRHIKNPPSKSDVADSRWRYSLMNWGHDPLRD
jgi:hypothetical protein